MNDGIDPIPLVGRDDPSAASGDVAADNIARLGELFPGAVGDGKVDFEVLRQLLGDDFEESEERYGLTWKGKRRARAFAMTPSLGTLRPSIADSVEWDRTRNIVIEGENTETLKILRRSYAGKVKLIYIDPPYNTGNNLIYKNDYRTPLKAYMEATGVSGADGTRFSTIKKGSGHFHTEWLNSFYPALLVSRDLLAEDGVLVITIDENELHNVIALCEDIYPRGGYDIDVIAVVHNPRGVQGKNFSYTHEYAVIVYKANTKVIGDRQIDPSEVDWAPLRNWGGESERSDAKNCFYPILVENGTIVGFGEVTPDDIHPAQTETVDGVAFVYPIDRNGVERKWRYARQSVEAIAPMLRAKKTATGYDVELGKTFGLYKSIWNETRYDANGYGTAILKDLVPDSPFDFPKSLWAVHDIVEAVTRGSDDALILDFFAGSGTTGHAVMQLNAETGSRHRFMLVQIPEPVAGHDRFGTIAQLTEERLRSVGKRLREQYPDRDFDSGFRVYKLATSNLKPWQPDADDLEASILDAVENVLSDRTEEDLLVELLLKTGVDLALPSECREIGGQTVHALGQGTLIACLGDITTDDVEPLGQGMADWIDALAPFQTTIYFKDSGLGTDGSRAATKANLAAILRHRLGDRIAKIASV